MVVLLEARRSPLPGLEGSFKAGLEGRKSSFLVDLPNTTHVLLGKMILKTIGWLNW